MQPNSLAFIALCNEFCSTLEGVAAGSDRAPSSRAELVASMLNYIPRLYISATDLKEEASADDSHDGHCGCGHDHCCDDEADDCCHCDDCSDSDELYTIADDHEGWGIESVLDEEYYNSVRSSIEALLSPDDVYLEVFEEDMKYSDTPISASVAEGLADIFQSLYNFIETVREVPSEHISSVLTSAKEDFEHYWSRIACNLMRALNNIRYFNPSDDENCDADQ